MKTLESFFFRMRTLFENRYEPEYAHEFADVFWYTILTVFCVVVLGVCAYGTSAFFEVLSEIGSGSQGPAPVTASPPIDQAKISAIANVFTARQILFSSLQEAPMSPIPDPAQ